MKNMLKMYKIHTDKRGSNLQLQVKKEKSFKFIKKISKKIVFRRIIKSCTNEQLI